MEISGYTGYDLKSMRRREQIVFILKASDFDHATGMNASRARPAMR